MAEMLLKVKYTKLGYYFGLLLLHDTEHIWTKMMKLAERIMFRKRLLKQFSSFNFLKF